MRVGVVAGRVGAWRNQSAHLRVALFWRGLLSILYTHTKQGRNSVTMPSGEMRFVGGLKLSDGLKQSEDNHFLGICNLVHSNA